MPMSPITPERHRAQIETARAELRRSLAELEDAKKAAGLAVKQNRARAREAMQARLLAVDQRAAALAALLSIEKALVVIPAFNSAIGEIALVSGVAQRAASLGAGSRYLGLLLAEADADMITEGLSPASAVASRQQVDRLIEKLKLDPSATL